MIVSALVLTMASTAMAENPLSDVDTFGIPWWGIFVAIGIFFLICVFIPQLGPKIKMGFGGAFILFMLIGLVMSPYTSILAPSEEVIVDAGDYRLSIAGSASGNTTYNDDESFTVVYGANETDDTIEQTGAAYTGGIALPTQSLRFNISVLPPADELYDSELTAAIELTSTVSKYNSGSTEYLKIAKSCGSGADEYCIVWDDGATTDEGAHTVSCGMGATVYVWCNITLSAELSHTSLYDHQYVYVSVGDKEYTVDLFTLELPT